MSRRLAIVAAALSAAAAAAWVFTYDDTALPPYALLGGYTHVTFVASAALTYAAVWCAVLATGRLDRRALFRVVAVHAAIAAVAAALELVAFLGVVDFVKLLPSGMKWRHEYEDAWQEPHRRMSGEAPQDLSVVMGVPAPKLPFEFATDRFGLRNPRDKDDPAVVCLGDSILVAGLVPVGSTVSERLEADLRADVLNVSQIGYSPEESLARFDTTGLDPKGRVFLHFLFEGNDAGDSERWRRAHAEGASEPWRAAKLPAGGLRWPDRGFLKPLVNCLYRHKPALASLRAGRFGAGPGTDVWFFYDGPMIESQADGFPGVEALVRAAKAWFESRGARYAVVAVPAKISVLHRFCTFPPQSHLADPAMAASSFRARLANACADAGVPFLDTTPGLVEVAERGELPYFAADTHLNATGLAAVARQVLPLARAELALARPPR